jgi:hypothetical protein
MKEPTKEKKRVMLRETPCQYPKTMKKKWNA